MLKGEEGVDSWRCDRINSVSIFPFQGHASDAVHNFPVAVKLKPSLSNQHQLQSLSASVFWLTDGGLLGVSPTQTPAVITQTHRLHCPMPWTYYL